MSKRLLQKNTQFLLTWLPLVFLGFSVLFYVMLTMQAHHMEDKQLQLKQTNVWNAFIASAGSMPQSLKGEYNIVENAGHELPGSDKPKDTSIYYADKGKILPFQTLTLTKQWNGKEFLLTTYVSSTEISHLIIKVFVTEACILILLLLAIVLLNKRNSGTLWRPFFVTIQQLDQYDINRNHSVSFAKNTGTTEFDELNKLLDQLIGNVNASYHHQKQFVENASHEMQTPLAIIRSKLELLINQPGLTETNAALLEDITQANDRLSQMNKTLLLLAKIEANQFPETEKIDLSRMLKQSLSDLQFHYENFPPLRTTIAEDVFIVANRSLVEVLIGNLIKNAAVHNTPVGFINITLTDNEFVIENPGAVLDIDPAQLFERFAKGSHSSKTTGLGLALVKQICTLYEFSVIYTHINGLHKITVRFS
jgi:signal transduction histidine kinase